MFCRMAWKIYKLKTIDANSPKDREEEEKKIKEDCAKLKLLEGIFESAPEFIFQLAILWRTGVICKLIRK